ncbi:MAG: hypothetical protein COA63_006990 [Methylophaga sp.]|nr:hypothetical protein [Methylophaga sp.]
MRLSQYLYRRPSGHYYFRIRTPQALKSEDTESSTGISLQSVMDAYAQEKIRAGNWTNKTEKEYAQIYELLFQIIGKEISTDELSYDISQKVKTTLFGITLKHHIAIFNKKIGS